MSGPGLTWQVLVLRRAGSVSGILSVATTTSLPLFGSMDFSFTVEGREPQDPAALPTGNMRVVSPAYFRTLGIPLLRGRGFTDEDRQDAPAVVVINESLGERYSADEDPIGRSLNTN